MKNLFTATIVTVSLMSGAAPAVLGAAGQAQTKSKPAATITRKGVIKTIDETSVSMAPNDNKKATMTFQLTPDVKRTGSLEAGAPAAVTYYLEDNRPIVTEIAGSKK